MQPLAASSSQTKSVSCDSWVIRVPTFACTPVSSSHSAGHIWTMTSAWLTALASPPMDGCPLASAWDYARISHGDDSWWPVSHNLSSGPTPSPIMDSWWTVEITACWMESRHCLFLHKLPVREHLASNLSAVDSILSEFLDFAHPTGFQREAWHNTIDHTHTTPGPPVDSPWTCTLLPKQSSMPCCEMAQLTTLRVLGHLHCI
jgi:hypothetical protein